MLIIRFCILFLIFLASGNLHAGVQRALLIGISDYESNLAPLPGSRNDVQLINQLLINQYGFEPTNIRVMLDAQATRQQIFSAIRSLSETAAPDDIVFIHFSGHGSQAPDTNGDEEDGYDETILPHDSRTEGIADITDDELNALIGSFQTRSVVVFLDSCHSGTGTRGGPAQVSQRWVVPDTREHLYRTTVTRGSVTLPISENHVLFAAAQDTQSELDGPFGPDNMRLGLFTAAMLGVLTNSPQSITPRQAIAGVNARVEVLKANAAGMPIPEPNMEAPATKQDQPMFVFQSELTPEPSATAQLPIADTSGSQIRLVRSIHATTSGVPQHVLARRIADAIGNGIGVASTIDVADAVVDVVGQGTYDVYGPGGIVQVASGLRSDGAFSGNSDSTSNSDFEFLSKVLRNAPILANLITLDNPQSNYQFELNAAGVAVTRTRNLSTRSIKVTVNTGSHRLQYYQPGAQRTRVNSLQLEALSNRDCYLSVVTVNSMGEVQLLLPNSGQEESGYLPGGHIRANTKTLIPDSLREDNNARFHFDYSPPGGHDKVIGVCSPDYPVAEHFRRQIAALESGETLNEAIFPVDSRGATNGTPGQAAPIAPWTVSRFSLDVGPD